MIHIWFILVKNWPNYRILPVQKKGSLINYCEPETFKQIWPRPKKYCPKTKWFFKKEILKIVMTSIVKKKQDYAGFGREVKKFSWLGNILWICVNVEFFWSKTSLWTINTFTMLVLPHGIPFHNVNGRAHETFMGPKDFPSSCNQFMQKQPSNEFLPLDVRSTFHANDSFNIVVLVLQVLLLQLGSSYHTST